MRSRNAPCLGVLPFLAGVAALALALLSCGGPADVIVSIERWPAAATQLRVRSQLNGTAGQEQTLSSQTTRFVLRLPPNAGGEIKLDVAALDANGCRAATGSLTVPVPAGLRHYIEVTVRLSENNPPLCGLHVAVKNGSGQIISTPPGISCSDSGGTCDVDLPSGTQVTLSALPGYRSFGGDFSGACSGSDSCSFVLGKDSTTTAYFTTAACNTDGWCWYSPLPTGNALAALWGSSATDVWAVGARGTILHFDGTAWNGGQAVTNEDLAGVWGASGQDVWAVGSKGTLLHYDGTRWAASSAGLTSGLNAVFGTSGSDVWAAGEQGKVLHYDGTRWSSVDSGVTTALNAIGGAAPDEIYIVGAMGVILRVQGSGLSKQTFAYSSDLYAVRAGNGGDLWVAGNTSFRRSGGTWAPITRPTGYVARGLGGSGANDMWSVSGTWNSTSLIGSGTIEHSNGITWIDAALGQSLPYLSAVWASGPNDAWAVGGYNDAADSAALYHWDGLKWSRSNPPAVRLTLRSLCASRPSEVWAGGDSGLLLRWDGHRVRSLNSGTGNSLASLWCSSTGDLWSAGSGAILRWDGNRFTSQYALGSSYYPQSIWGTSSSDIYVPASNYNSTNSTYTGYVFHWDGAMWTITTVTTSVFLTAISGTSSKDLWLVGYGTGGAGTPLAWRSANGTSWPSISLSGGGSLLDVWAASPTEVFAVGNSSTVQELVGSSFVLRTLPAGAPSTIMSIHGTSSADVWAVGIRGGLIHRQGTSWTTVQSSSLRHLNRVLVLAGNDVWIAGDYSTLLRYQP